MGVTNNISKMKFLPLLTVVAAQKTAWFASCPAPTIIADFDLSRYAGKWYEDGRYTVATYEAIDETTISVNNSEISTGRFGQTKRSEIIGRGEQTYPDSQPNGLKVTFSFSNKVIDFFANLAFSFSK